LRNHARRAARDVAFMPEPMPRKPKAPTCDDCFFAKNGLCALELDEACATFRPNRPEGLVPPRQPVLLMRAPRWAASGRAASAV
jgi:hypothetical protein